MDLIYNMKSLTYSLGKLNILYVEPGVVP